MAGHPHLPPQARDRHALAGGLQPQAVDAAGFHRLRARAQQPLVDHPADGGADRTPDDGAAKAHDGSAEPRADRRANG